MADRPEIPSEIKRCVRERCGYGCVICGAQPYDYDHIIEYEEVKCHEAGNLTLLCKHHHGEKTLKNLPREIVEKANLNPFNLISENTTSRTLYYAGRSIEVRIGGNVFVYENMVEGFSFVPIQIDEESIISFKYEKENLLLSFRAFDRENNQIVEIFENEISHTTSVWDAEWKANKLTLREGNGRFLLRMKFEAPNILTIDKGYFHFNHTDLLLDHELLFLGNTGARIHGNKSVNCKVGMEFSGYGPYNTPWKEVKHAFRKARKKL